MASYFPLIAWHSGVDFTRPRVDTAGQRTNVDMPEPAQVSSRRQAAHAVMAVDDNHRGGFEWNLGGASRNLIERNQQAVGQFGDIIFPGLANIDQANYVTILEIG